MSYASSSSATATAVIPPSQKVANIREELESCIIFLPKDLRELVLNYLKTQSALMYQGGNVKIDINENTGETALLYPNECYSLFINHFNPWNITNSSSNECNNEKFILEYPKQVNLHGLTKVDVKPWKMPTIACVFHRIWQRPILLTFEAHQPCIFAHDNPFFLSRTHLPAIGVWPVQKDILFCRGPATLCHTVHENILYICLRMAHGSIRLIQFDIETQEWSDVAYLPRFFEIVVQIHYDHEQKYFFCFTSCGTVLTYDILGRRRGQRWYIPKYEQARDGPWDMLLDLANIYRECDDIIEDRLCSGIKYFSFFWNQTMIIGKSEQRKLVSIIEDDEKNPKPFKSSKVDLQGVTLCLVNHHLYLIGTSRPAVAIKDISMLSLQPQTPPPSNDDDNDHDDDYDENTRATTLTYYDILHPNLSCF